MIMRTIMRTITNILVAALLVLVLLLALVLNTGCADKEPQIEVCLDCIGLKSLLEEAKDTTKRAISAAEEYGEAVDGLRAMLADEKTDNRAKMKLASSTMRSLEDQLLKANTEIVTCWKIIEESNLDPNEPVKYGQGDPPAAYIDQFGNDNGARLNFVQNQDMAKIVDAVNKQTIALAELDKRVTEIEKTCVTTAIIEDHSKCILDQDGKCCTTRGCKVLNPDEVVK